MGKVNDYFKIFLIFLITMFHRINFIWFKVREIKNPQTDTRYLFRGSTYDFLVISVPTRNIQQSVKIVNYNLS